MNRADELRAWASDWQYIVMKKWYGSQYEPHGNLHSITLFKLLRNAKKAAQHWKRDPDNDGVILRFIPSLLPAVHAGDIVAGDDADEYQFAERMATLWAERAAALATQRRSGQG